MEKITGNEPINFVEQWGNQDDKMYGLTIRQHFAAMAMQGMLANPKNGYDKKAAVVYAEDALFVADALINKLNESDDD